MSKEGPERRTRRKRLITWSLEGDLVCLRPPMPADTEQLYKWLNDPELSAPWDRFETDSYSVFAEELHKASSDPTSLYPRFLIVKRDSGEPIGVAGYYRAHRVFEGVDIWYVIAIPSERRKGYGREAVRLLVGHIFAHTPVERVGATCDIENAGSIGLLESLRFRREGSLSKALFHHGEWHNVAQYGITREEWNRKH